MVRRSGASEVHARVGSPAIIAPCYLGIDMATRQELIASYKTIKGVESLINADSLGYLSIDGSCVLWNAIRTTCALAASRVSTQ